MVRKILAKLKSIRVERKAGMSGTTNLEYMIGVQQAEDPMGPVAVWRRINELSGEVRALRKDFEQFVKDTGYVKTIIPHREVYERKES